MKVFIIAGEPSGDALGGALMDGLRKEGAGAQYAGIGGPVMQAHGLDSLFAMEELSVMGLAEVLPKLRGLFRRRDEAVAACLAFAPDVLITIDSPDFCLRVARKLKVARPDLKTIHYVAPTVWAWRPKRVERMRGVIDHVLALLPFEPPYMEAAGMSCDFVGHPITTEPVANAREATLFRRENGLGQAPVILALPGSRRGEVSRLMEPFGAALEGVIAQHPEARVVLPAAAPVAGQVIARAASWPGAPVILDPRGKSPEQAVARKRAAFRAADVALAASGTVSLELAASDTPMVIAYDMNWVSRQMLKRMLKIDTVTLVNLVSQTRAVPEYLGDACVPADIATAVTLLLEDPSARKAQLAAFGTVMEALGRGGEAPGRRAARSVLAQLE